MDDNLRRKFEARYRTWKEKLLDLSGSNRLLNFRATKVSTIQLTLPDAQSLFERLVVSEKALKFPLFEGRASLAADLVDSETSPVSQPTWRVRPGDLETSKSPPDLEKALGRLLQLARSSLEERGVNTLYVALGMLEWRPLDGAEPQRAPLLMVPIELSRETRLNPYVLSPFDEDAEINPSLIYMLRKDFEFAAPEFDSEPDPGSLQKFFHGLERSVKGRGWRVVQEAWLGQFQFKKLAMYKDLEEHSTSAASHEVLTAVAGSTEFGQSPDVPADHEFDGVKPWDVFTIRDADSSQLAAILRARAKQDLIIQGPPGTGKSQTIANLIAQFLLEGRKILFVSEKMAALSVVYKRLRESGLHPFCLEIHSDKANKRDVLARIRRARPAVSPRISSQERLRFETLLNYRRELNEYVRDLHQVALHGRSAFDVHGEISVAADIPDVVAKLGFTADDLSADREFELLKLVRKLAQIPAVLGNYNGHPWFGCTLRLWSLQIQASVAANFERFRNSIGEASSLCGHLVEQMSAPAPNCISDLHEILETAKLFCESPCPPEGWMHNADLRGLAGRARDLAIRSQRYRELRTGLEEFYETALFERDCSELDRVINPSVAPVFQSIRRDSPRHVIAESGNRVIDELRSSLSALSELYQLVADLATMFQEPKPATLKEYRRLAKLGTLASSDPRPTRGWFEWPTLDKLREDVQGALARSDRLTDLKPALCDEFSPEFFELPLAAWRTDFGSRYSSIWRVAKPQYHRTRKALQRTRKSKSKLSHADAERKVIRGAEVVEIDAWFLERREDYSTSLGLHYRASETQWRLVTDHIETVRKIMEVERGAPPPALMECLLAGGATLRRIGEVGTTLSAKLETFDSSLDRLRQYLDVEVLCDVRATDDSALESLEKTLKDRLDWLIRYQAAVESVKGALRRESRRDPSSMAQDVAHAREVQDIEREYAGAAQTLQESFGHFYRGIGTDWSRSLAAIEWTTSFIRYLGEHLWRDQCLAAACSAERVEGSRYSVTQLQSIVARISEDQAFHAEVFDEATFRLAGKTLERAGFPDLTAWLGSKVDDIGKLSEWIQFREIRDECARTGIDEFLDRALDMGVPPENFEHALKKRLLTVQLDAIYSQLPRLRKFQWRDHEQLILAFSKLDRELMTSYATLVQAAVAARQPNLEGPAAGQVGFLKKELAKQKRHAPLRRLFQESGNVVLDLTPCLLMSPLSVATFLPKDAVHFDVVIFDEASQVPSEEATGAILRGSQLIVAGDVNQLPPTRFFERVADDGGEDDDDMSAPLDSLLEDCNASGMQSCRLQWHYRSKHEALISFSNAEFYENDLITFPAPNTQLQVGIGVRLVHVADGVYDRGRSRTNRREAQEVAQLIEQHCDTWGRKRSLGVIALSTAQEAAILEELERLLLRRPDLEILLKQGSDEAFFVKPLENVQGDERDTIILTVGYGKDATGSLSLNFGPINSQGGEKRLNVAVTRARWELIVVSSILAYDIDESRVQSIGPKLLRRYLDFAKEGRLPAATTAPTGESESPFELSVWQALRGLGMEVDRQVGTSRYRIDMAIKNPERPGKYLLGVECDGATYHSSVVARDRDRLRQQILEDLGWRIHRIWSTDWVRDPKGCLLRLLQRIDELKGLPEDLGNTMTVVIADVNGEPASEEDTGVGIFPEEPTEDDPYRSRPEIGIFRETPGGFRPKEEFYANDAMIDDDLMRVVNREGPIHEELLVRRVARTFQLMRTGHLVEARINSRINAACRQRKIHRKGKFVWVEGGNAVPPRRPAPGIKLRDIDHVPPEELQSAVLLVVRLTRGITEDELLGEAARVLGYIRITDHIRSITGRAVRALLKSGSLVVRGEQLVVAE